MHDLLMMIFSYLKKEHFFEIPEIFPVFFRIKKNRGNLWKSRGLCNINGFFEFSHF